MYIIGYKGQSFYRESGELEDDFETFNRYFRKNEKDASWILLQQFQQFS